MSNLKYEYLFNKDNILIHHLEAVRLNEYKLYADSELDFIYKAGDQRQFFSLKIDDNNIFSNVGGESVQHYNAKMKIVYDKKYFDSVFNTYIYFDDVIPEEWLGKKRPDLSCYQDNKLVACIEIHNTNKKTLEDIEIFKELSCLIVEIDINNENKCEHIALPKIFEIYRKEYYNLKSRIRDCKTEFEILANKIDSNYGGTKREIGIIEEKNDNIKYEFDRLSKDIKGGKYFDSKFKEIENKSKFIDKRSGILNKEIIGIENEIISIENSINKTAKNCKIEWFRSEWMGLSSQNKIEEIKYWTS